MKRPITTWKWNVPPGRSPAAAVILLAGEEKGAERQYLFKKQKLTSFSWQEQSVV